MIMMQCSYAATSQTAVPVMQSCNPDLRGCCHSKKYITLMEQLAAAVATYTEGNRVCFMSAQWMYSSE